MTESKFKVGDIVILQNLEIHPEFNGLESTVTGPLEPREPRRGVEPMPIEYLYAVDINLTGCEPGLLVAEDQMRHRKPPVELGSWSLTEEAINWKRPNVVKTLPEATEESVGESISARRFEGLQEAEACRGSPAGSDLQISGEATDAPPAHRNEAPQHLQLQNPVSLESWKDWLRAVDSTTTFHDYPRAFRDPVEITNELQQLLDDFGEKTRKSVFAVRHSVVEGVWLDPHHNYLAIEFTKASGDPEDCVLITSFSLTE